MPRLKIETKEDLKKIVGRQNEELKRIGERLDGLLEVRKIEERERERRGRWWKVW